MRLFFKETMQCGRPRGLLCPRGRRILFVLTRLQSPLRDRFRPCEGARQAGARNTRGSTPNLYLQPAVKLMPCGKKRKRHKIATHKRKKRLRKNRHKKKK